MKKFFIFVVLMAVVAGTSLAEEAYSPREKLILMRERVLRDLEYAKELRGRAMLQKGRLGEIMKKAEAGARDPNMDPEVFKTILAGAPEGMRRAEETLTKTEKIIRDLNVRLEEADRALKNLPAKDGRDYFYETLDVGKGYAIGPGTLANVQVLRHGHDETIALGKQKFLPGDTLVTDAEGQVTVKASWSTDTLVTVGPETRVQLEKDRKEGTQWRLEKGIVHCREDEFVRLEAPAGSIRKLPVIVTAEAVVMGDAESEFDVRVDEKGQTFVEVYSGRVEVKEPKKGTSYFVKPEGISKAPRWWEKKEWWQVTSE